MHTQPKSRSTTGGFTLLELMTAIAVLGILVAIGVPSFASISRGNQIAAASSNLVSALQLARSEALTRGIRVSVCAANADGSNCSGTTAWSQGWIMFSDDFGAAGVLEVSDKLLQVWAAPAQGVAIATEAESVTFARTARAEFPETFTVSKPGCGAQQLRSIDVDRSGRVALSRTDCPAE